MSIAECIVVFPRQTKTKRETKKRRRETEEIVPKTNITSSSFIFLDINSDTKYKYLPVEGRL